MIRPTVWLTFWKISSASARTWPASIALAFARDGRTRDAVERCLERICEAAYRLGDQAEGLMPGQHWADIRGMGNRLRDAYDRMNLDVIWNTIREDLPGLAADVQAALERLRPGKPK
jgi:uncharacterized protein with HEPN domain